ncbi:MAG: histidine phosphatase family protein [Armatimonadota bacterium]
MEGSLKLGDRLLAALSALPAGAPAVLFIRHSERYDIEQAAKPDEVMLTPAGEEAARAFGGRLPPARRLRVYHSPMPRCRVTAERIAEGFAAAGGQVTFYGVLDGLCRIYLTDLPGVRAVIRQYQDDGRDIIRGWFDGRLDPAMIDPCPVAAEKLLRVAEFAGDGAGADSLTVLVTHDWELLTLRETFLGVRHEEVGWVDFLDGLAMARDGEGWLIRWREFCGRECRMV